LPFKEISTGILVKIVNTIMKDHPRTITGRFGLNWLIEFRIQDQNVTILTTMTLPDQDV